MLLFFTFPSGKLPGDFGFDPLGFGADPAALGIVIFMTFHIYAKAHSCMLLQCHFVVLTPSIFVGECFTWYLQQPLQIPYQHSVSVLKTRTFKLSNEISLLDTESSSTCRNSLQRNSVRLKSFMAAGPCLGCLDASRYEIPCSILPVLNQWF